MKEYTNEITKEIDLYLTEEWEGTRMKTYIANYDEKHWCIRFPGATRGSIQVDDNLMIVDIQIYDNAIIGFSRCYKDSIKDALLKFINTKLILE